jgi:thioesterase domain-containing protein
MAMGKEVKMLGILDTYIGYKSRNEPLLRQIVLTPYHFAKRMGFNIAEFVKDPKGKYAFDRFEVKKKMRVYYYRILKLMGKKRINYFYYKNQVAKNNGIALDNYVLKPYDGILYLFRSIKKSYYMPDFEFLGWKKFARRIRIFEIPGDHNSIFTPENEAGVAKVLQTCLDELAVKNNDSSFKKKVFLTAV